MRYFFTAVFLIITYAELAYSSLNLAPNAQCNQAVKQCQAKCAQNGVDRVAAVNYCAIFENWDSRQNSTKQFMIESCQCYDSIDPKPVRNYTAEQLHCSAFYANIPGNNATVFSHCYPIYTSTNPASNAATNLRFDLRVSKLPVDFGTETIIIEYIDLSQLHTFEYFSRNDECSNRVIRCIYYCGRGTKINYCRGRPLNLFRFPYVPSSPMGSSYWIDAKCQCNSYSPSYSLLPAGTPLPDSDPLASVSPLQQRTLKSSTSIDSSDIPENLDIVRGNLRVALIGSSMGLAVLAIMIFLGVQRYRRYIGYNALSADN